MAHILFYYITSFQAYLFKRFFQVIVNFYIQISKTVRFPKGACLSNNVCYTKFSSYENGVDFCLSWIVITSKIYIQWSFTLVYRLFLDITSSQDAKNETHTFCKIYVLIGIKIEAFISFVQWWGISYRWNKITKETYLTILIVTVVFKYCFIFLCNTLFRLKTQVCSHLSPYMEYSYLWSVCSDYSFCKYCIASPFSIYLCFNLKKHPCPDTCPLLFIRTVFLVSKYVLIQRD